MELPERKRTILQAIIRTYLETGEPVGSRTISKYTDLHLSSATIRNEMSDLEEMGLIVQPHTSAGRVPTDKGYRLYVDEMLAEKTADVEKQKAKLLEREDRLEELLKQAAKLLAAHTNYASMVTTPTIRQNKIKFIQLTQVDSKHILAVIVIEGNLVRNKLIPVDEVFPSETILKMNMLLNSALDGLAVEEINLRLIAEIKRQAGVNSELVSHVLDAAGEAIAADKQEIFTSGADNIFRYPELAENEKASRLIGDLEEKKTLGNIVEESLHAPEEKGIQVYIGNELPTKGMEDCSVVTAVYDMGDGMKGTIGVIGPKRMDYDKVVDALKSVMHELSDYYKKD